MRTGACISVVVIIYILVLLSIISNALYVDWIFYVAQDIFGSSTYIVFDGKGIASTEYASLDSEPIHIYPMFVANETITGRNYTLIYCLDENGAVKSSTSIRLAEYRDIYPEEAEVFPDNNYVIFALRGIDLDNDHDGILALADLELTDVTVYILEGINKTYNSTGFTDLFIASNNHVYVVGYIYNSVRDIFDGILVDFYYNGSGLEFEGLTTYMYSDSNSNLLIFTDVTVGPDGYIYVAGYVPLYNSTNDKYYDYMGLVLKIDPQTHNITKYVGIRLWNIYGKLGLATFSGSVCSDDKYIYATFNTLSDKADDLGYYTRASVIEKLDTELNNVWERIWNDVEYDNVIYDIIVTTDNLTVVGTTDNSYGYTEFQGYNAIVLTLNPVDGGGKHGYLVGGSGNEVFKDPSVDYKGYLYTVGHTTTDPDNMYEAYISPDEISLTSPQQHHNTAHIQSLKPARIKSSVPLMERIIKPPKPLEKYKPLTRTMGLKKSATIKNPVVRFGVNMTSNDLIEPISGTNRLVELQVLSRPGIAVKFASPIGVQPTPPPPVPENDIVIITGTVIGLVLIGYAIYKRRI